MNDNGAAAKSSQQLTRQPRRLSQLGLVAVAWAGFVAATTWFNLTYGQGWANTGQIAQVCALYGLGALIAFPIAQWICSRLPLSGRTSRIIMFCLLLGFLTLLATAAVIALAYRQYYAQWHADPFSRLWFIQQVFTMGGAVYQYLVLGLRFYSWLALAGLMTTSLWVYRLTH